MTVNAYIPYRDNDEVGFDTPHERKAAIQLLQMMSERYAGTKANYTLIFNLRDPQIDALVLSQSGMAVLEFKNVEGTLHGGADTAWESVSREKKHLEIRTGRFTNPFVQVDAYRCELEKKLELAATRGLIPALLRKAHIDAAVVFTAGAVDWTRLDPSPENPRNKWFRFLRLHDVPEWVYTVCYGDGVRLKPAQIASIAKDYFQVKAWSERGADDPAIFGYLCHAMSKKNHPLRKVTTTIGRDEQMDFNISNDWPTVSRKHALIRKTPAGIYLQDLESSFGTRVNNRKLAPGEECLLRNGDVIMVGQSDTSLLGSGKVYTLTFNYTIPTALPTYPRQEEDIDVPGQV